MSARNSACRFGIMYFTINIHVDTGTVSCWLAKWLLILQLHDYVLVCDDA